MIQSATPALAVLPPILANQGKGDVEFSTNVVTQHSLICDCGSNSADIVGIAFI